MNLEINSRAQGLIFDLDGTLADSMPLHFNAWKITAKEFGFIYPEEMFYDLAGMPTIKIVPLVNEKLNLNLDPVEFSRRKEEVFLDLLPRIKPIEKVTALVISSYGRLPMSVGTGGRRHIALKTLAVMGIDCYIDIVVAADDVSNHKPAPDTFLKCSELMNVQPQYCQVFEDGDMGIEAAKRAGMIATDVRPFL